MIRVDRLVIPIDYSSARNGTSLSDATTTVLEAAIGFANEQQEGNTLMAFCNTDIPSMNLHAADSAKSKDDILKSSAHKQIQHIMVSATSSITEVHHIRDALARAQIRPDHIVIFCDRWHAVRLRFIWPRIFPLTDIEFRTASYVRGRDHMQILLRNRLSWALANIAGLVAMRIFGISLLASIRQP